MSSLRRNHLSGSTVGDAPPFVVRSETEVPATGGHGQHGAGSLFPGLAQGDGALVESRHFPDEAEAEAAAFVAGPGAGEGVEAFEDAFLGEGGDAFSFVLDLEFQLIAFEFCGDAEGAAVRGEFDGVLQQIAEGAFEEKGIGREDEAGSGVALDLEASLLDGG